MTVEKTKVLYIAGMGRSGSTILGRLLGELPGAVHVGEIGLFSAPRFQETARCECLKMVAECPFWNAVFEQAFGGLNSLDLTAIQETRKDYRLRGVPSLMLPKTAAQSRRLEEYLDTLGKLYAAIRDVSGAKVVVDGSKDIIYAHLLKKASTLDLQRVHLIRDSRAVAFSYQRVKKDPPLYPNPGQLDRLPPWQTAVHWNTVNLLLGAARNSGYFFLRYEDFVANPAETLRFLWSLVGEPVPPMEFLDASPVHLHPGHTVAGNPDRFQSEVKIKPDLEWQRKMKPGDRRLVTALTLPLLLRCGYLRPQQSAEAATQIQPSRVL